MRILLIGTIFLSAFLLFLVQPIIAKQITPWFGGTSSTWATCMMFFQVALLLGYTYSDFVVRRILPKTQSMLHIGLLVAAILTLPIIPTDTWKPTADSEPTLQVLALLLFTVGLPYFMLATTGPLLQAWYTRRFPGNGVYRLFALSNLASLAALIAYPFVIEPYFTTAQQSWGWSIGFALFAISCMLSAWNGRKDSVIENALESALPVDEKNTLPRLTDYLVWLALAAMGSMLLLSVTNHITQNVASVPFLWLLPLTIYLLTFILCFDGHGWYRRGRFVGLVLTLLFLMAGGLSYDGLTTSLWPTLTLYIAGLFACCMFLHGELADRKPSPRYLTRFYLMVSLGGALGSIFVSAIAPNVFSNYFELPIALVLTALLLLVLLRQYLTNFGQSHRPLAMAIFSVACTAYFSWVYYEDVNKNAIFMQRNFYGSLSVIAYPMDSKDDIIHDFVNGTILHGRQFQSPQKKNLATSYFGAGSGPAYILKKMSERPLQVGVLGLGVGTVALYGKAGDYFRFYEINPDAQQIAQEYFSYLRDSPAKIDIVLGDGRLSLERELAMGKPGKFDVLMLDAFTGDSVPIHLLTREALQIYRQHIKPDGVIIFNTSNIFVDLPPAIKHIANEAGMQAIKLYYRPHEDQIHLLPSDWVLVTNNEDIVNDLKARHDVEPIVLNPELTSWTDSHSNLFQILRY